MQDIVSIVMEQVLHICFKYVYFKVSSYLVLFCDRFALFYRTVLCLSVTLVYCGQTVGWIRMPIGMKVGLGPGHIMLDGDSAPPRKGLLGLRFNCALLGGFAIGAHA